MPDDLNGNETCSLTLKEHRLRVYVSKVIWKIFGLKREKVTGSWKQLHNN
jgi:hypothetical protein